MLNPDNKILMMDQQVEILTASGSLFPDNGQGGSVQLVGIAVDMQTGYQRPE